MRLVRCGLILMLGLAAAPAFAKSDDTLSAREHYKRGTTLYDLGKYEEAIVEFEQAYQIKDDPVLLYNIAQSHRLSNHYTEALRAYRTYLRRSPKAPNRDEVEQKIADMEALIAQQARVQNGPPSEAIPPKGDHPAVDSLSGGPNATVASRTEPKSSGSTAPTEGQESGQAKPAETKPAETKPVETKPVETKPAEEPIKTEAPRRSPPMMYAGIVAAVVGAAAAGVGAYFMFKASSLASDQEKSPVFLPDTQSQGQSYALIGPILAGAGGAIAVAGAALAVLGSRRVEAAPKVSLLPALAPGFSGAAVHVRF